MSAFPPFVDRGQLKLHNSKETNIASKVFQTVDILEAPRNYRPAGTTKRTLGTCSKKTEGRWAENIVYSVVGQIMSAQQDSCVFLLHRFSVLVCDVFAQASLSKFLSKNETTLKPLARLDKHVFSWIPDSQFPGKASSQVLTPETRP